MIEVEINFVLKNLLVSLKFNFEPSSMNWSSSSMCQVIQSFDDCHCVKFYINLQFIVKRNPKVLSRGWAYSAELSRCQSAQSLGDLGFAFAMSLAHSLNARWSVQDSKSEQRSL